MGQVKATSQAMHRLTIVIFDVAKEVSGAEFSCWRSKTFVHASADWKYRLVTTINFVTLLKTPS